MKLRYKISSLLLIGAIAVMAGPRFTLSSDEIDVGDLTAEESRVGTVKFVNDGDEPLEIERVTTDCGCTVADYPRNEIAPGDSAEIKVRFSGRGREPGSFKKIIRIRSNASKNRTLLFVKGRIVRPLTKWGGL